MDIILLERVGNLGTIGDVVTVKDGYARNFLLPNKKALRANKANKEVFEANRERLEKENEERRAAAAKFLDVGHTVCSSRRRLECDRSEMVVPCFFCCLFWP